MTDKLNSHHQHYRQQCATENAEQQELYTRKREGLEEEQRRMMQQYHQESVTQERPYTQHMDTRLKVLKLLARREQAQQSGTQEGHEHRSTGIDTRCIAEHIDHQSQCKGHSHQSIAVYISVECQDEVYIYKRCGQTKEADIVEKQHLHQCQSYKPCYASKYPFHITSSFSSASTTPAARPIRRHPSCASRRHVPDGQIVCSAAP